jgi:hypothetical protein
MFVLPEALKPLFESLFKRQLRRLGKDVLLFKISKQEWTTILNFLSFLHHAREEII